MKRKSQFKPRQRFSRRHSQSKGFVLPAVVGLGLIMLLFAITVMVQSQSDRITASAQRNTAQSIAIAEGGTQRVIATLKANPHLLTLNYDTVNSNTSKTYLGQNQIQNDGDEESSAVNTWQYPTASYGNGCPAPTGPVPLPAGLTAGTIGSGSYTLRSYRIDSPTSPSRGVALVEGTEGVASSRVQIAINVRKTPQANSFPGLYASSSITLGNNDVLKISGGVGTSANVICKDCVVPTSYCTNGQPSQLGLNYAVDKGPNSSIDGKIYIANPGLPAVPTPPSNATCSSGVNGTACRIVLGSLNPSTTSSLPRSTDIATHKAGTPYHYVFTDVPLGNNVLTIDTSSDPVYLYVSGNITLNGNGGFRHTGSAERFVIFGNPADPTDSTPDQQFTISGGSSTSNVFIYAPDARAGINGGSSDPDILGAIWIKVWDGSSSNNAEIRVPDNMGQLLTAALGASFGNAGVQLNAVSGVNNWQQNEVR